MEVIELDALQPAHPTDPTVELTYPTSIDSGAIATTTWLVSNAGSEIAYDVSVTGSVVGANSVQTLTTSVGSCSIGQKVTCSLGDMEPGASATIELTLMASYQDIELSIRVDDGPSCDSDVTNNASSGTIHVVGEDGGVDSNSNPVDAAEELPKPLSIDTYESGGGCSCRTVAVPAPNGQRGWLTLLGLGAASLGMRKRRRS